MIFEGRSISPGKARGEVIKLDEPLSFLGGVDGSTGDIRVGNGGNVAGRILVFPKGKGSTVGSFVMYDLMVHGKAPAAVINESAETIVATGAVISSIPMVDSIPSINIFEDGDIVTVDASAGTVEIEDVEVREVASSVIFVDGKVLMLKRPKTNARREILEETGISVSAPDAVMRPIYVREGKVLWKVWPFLYRLNSANPVINEENEEFDWVDPESLQGKDTVTDTRTIVEYLLSRN